MSIDNCLHSIFGASKVAADVMCQEFGRYFQMPVGVFRGGCLTGPQHSAVELHGYLVYIIICAMTGKEYQVYGYKGKQVRDQIHSPRRGQPVPGILQGAALRRGLQHGRRAQNSISILETIDLLAGMGYTLKHSYKPENRIGDHICYISDLSKIYTHFPNWKLEYDLPRIIGEIVHAHTRGISALASSHRSLPPKTTSFISARCPSIHSAMSLSGAARIALRRPAANGRDRAVVRDVKAAGRPGRFSSEAATFTVRPVTSRHSAVASQQREAVRTPPPTFQCRPA